MVGDDQINTEISCPPRRVARPIERFAKVTEVERDPRQVRVDPAEQARIVGARPKGRLVAELAEFLPTLSR